jgi:DNA polymerase-3 subunit chi
VTTEVLFYHLERAGLEEVLPGLLERTLERGWKAVVCVGSQERMAALDSHLWTFRDESFIPHAMDNDPRATTQPILLTTGGANLNGASVAFYADGAAPNDWSPDTLSEYQRVVLLFDGRDPQATDAARVHWKGARASGCETTYWQQSASGKWEKKA